MMMIEAMIHIINKTIFTHAQMNMICVEVEAMIHNIINKTIFTHAQMQNYFSFRFNEKTQENSQSV